MKKSFFSRKKIDSFFFIILVYLCERCESNYRFGETKINKKKEIHFLKSETDPIKRFFPIFAVKLGHFIINGFSI